MAVTVTPVLSGANLHIADITATADADIAAVVPHGLGSTPTIVLLTDMLTVVSALSAWAYGVIDATNVNVVATAAVGSGDAAVQLRVTVSLPHSLFR